MEITVKINSYVPSEHYYLTATVNGTRTFDFTITKADLALKKMEPEEILYILLRNFIKESGLTNWTQIKTALEAHRFKL
jgi:fibronectin type 3 domain-containing protein